MSEPCQLFARIRLSRPQLDQFLESAFPDTSGDAELLAWLATAGYDEDGHRTDAVRDRLCRFSTIGAWIEHLMQPSAGCLILPSASRYDETTQTWTLGVLDFPEAYDDFIAAIAAFRAIARFKDLPGDGDGMLIYGYMYEHGYVVTALGIERGACRFLDDGVPRGLSMQANAEMQWLISHSATSAFSSPG